MRPTSGRRGPLAAAAAVAALALAGASAVAVGFASATDGPPQPPRAQAASVVSTNSDVRKTMVRHQREIGNAAPKGCVLEGRDIGSVVFPDADIKFFLTAKPEARARRRYEEDKAKGRVTTYEQTLSEINERDQRDVSRANSPLTIAEDAVVIDTSELDLTEVFDAMLAKISDRRVSASVNRN